MIVGAGAAGMAAAVSAADEGADSVVVFEKQANIGGNAIVSGGFIENLGLPEELKADNDAGYEARVLNALEDVYKRQFKKHSIRSGSVRR